jgi:hypothetical protein
VGNTYYNLVQDAKLLVCCLHEDEKSKEKRLKKKHNEEILDLYPSPNILEVTK